MREMKRQAEKQTMEAKQTTQRVSYMYNVQYIPSREQVTLYCPDHWSNMLFIIMV